MCARFALFMWHISQHKFMLYDVNEQIFMEELEGRKEPNKLTGCELGSWWRFSRLDRENTEHKRNFLQHLIISHFSYDSYFLQHLLSAAALRMLNVDLIKFLTYFYVKRQLFTFSRPSELRVPLLDWDAHHINYASCCCYLRVAFHR